MLSVVTVEDARSGLYIMLSRPDVLSHRVYHTRSSSSAIKVRYSTRVVQITTVNVQLSRGHGKWSDSSSYPALCFLKPLRTLDNPRWNQVLHYSENWMILFTRCRPFSVSFEVLSNVRCPSAPSLPVRLPLRHRSRIMTCRSEPN